MANSYHVRSNSLPSKPHPFASEFDEHLNRLKSSEPTSTSSSSIGHSLNGLQDLYDCLDNLLQLQLSQQSLLQDHDKKYVQDLLDGSLMLLDMCSVAKDSLQQIKESTLKIQSLLRRRRGGESELDEIRKYLNLRKAVKKVVHKLLKTLKIKEICVGDEDLEAKATVDMVKEVESMTFTAFKSLLSFISGPKAQSKLSGWSVVSKLTQSKRIACENNEADLNEFEKVEFALHSFIRQQSRKFDDIFHLQNQLKDLEMCIQDLEEGIESLSRRLIKSRVAFLNILNN